MYHVLLLEKTAAEKYSWKKTILFFWSKCLFFEPKKKVIKIKLSGKFGLSNKYVVIIFSRFDFYIVPLNS